ncbi:hypothetical protein HanPI659440_Chr08g0299251 [Helianthus annuus]|nr:hypothetical protein HanPI659440_Chr08g0299251 [Helianthus annuus]
MYELVVSSQSSGFISSGTNYGNNLSNARRPHVLPSSNKMTRKWRKNDTFYTFTLFYFLLFRVFEKLYRNAR